MTVPESDMRIVGERIYLRPMTLDDTAFVLKARNCERTKKNFFYRQTITEEGHKIWFRENVDTGKVHQFIVCLKENDQPIGCVNVQHPDDAMTKMESGLFFDEDAPAGKGYATEAYGLLISQYAFKTLHLHKVYARVLETNIASRRVHDKTGFTEEGILRDEMLIEGKFVTIVMYGLINPED